MVKNKKMQQQLDKQQEAERRETERRINLLKKNRADRVLLHPEFENYKGNNIRCRELFYENGLHYYRINVFGPNNYIIKSWFVVVCFDGSDTEIKTLEIR